MHTTAERVRWHRRTCFDRRKDEDFPSRNRLRGDRLLPVLGGPQGVQVRYFGNQGVACMTNFLIAAAVVCLALIARMLWRIQQALARISQDIELTQQWDRDFWRERLDGPQHACDSKRIWIRRGLDRHCQFVWDLGIARSPHEITGLGGSIAEAEGGADVDAKKG